jgi:hypothetical protein
MTDTPRCPVHPQAVLREGQYGLFCPTKMPDGSWCKTKFKKQAPEAPQHSSEPVKELQTLPKVRLAEAALAFAGAVYHGSGPVGANEALVLAQTAYKWLCDPSDTEGLGF